jgi:hypothetical protein
VAKKKSPKSPELLKAEYFYLYGRRDALSDPPPSGTEREIVISRTETALKQWKARAGKAGKEYKDGEKTPPLDFWGDE